MQDNFTSHEEELRRLSEAFSIEVDSAELWNEIEGKLPPVDSKKRRGLYWWFATAVIFFAGLVFVVFKQNAASVENAPQSIVADALNPDKIESQAVEQKTPLKNNSAVKELKSTNVEMREDTAPLKNPEINLQEKSIAEKNKSNDHIAITINQNRYDERSSDRRLEVIDHKPHSGSQDEVVVNPSLGNLDSASEVEEPTVEIEEPTVRSIVLVHPLPSERIMPLENTQRYAPQITPIKPLKFDQWLPSFSVFMGSNLSINTIAGTTSEPIDLSDIESEQALPGWSTSLRYTWENTRNWRLGIGVSHHRLVNRFARNEIVTDVEEIMSSAAFSEIDNKGNVTFNPGVLTQTTITDYEFQRHRTHDFVDLQLLVGRKLFELHNFTVNSDLVVSGSLISRHEGYFFVNNNEMIQRFSASENNPYSKRLVHAGLSVDLQYNFNNVSIGIRPFVDLALNNLLETSDYYQLKNSRYGVQLGIVYRP